MPKLSQKATVTATTKTEVTLLPAVKRKLLTVLREYQELDLQEKALKLAKNKIKDKVRSIREATGERSINLDGFTMTDVQGTQKKFNKKKALQYLTVAELDDCFDEKPKKAYEKITCPGDDDTTEED